MAADKSLNTKKQKMNGVSTKKPQAKKAKTQVFHQEGKARFDRCVFTYAPYMVGKAGKKKRSQEEIGVTSDNGVIVAKDHKWWVMNPKTLQSGVVVEASAIDVITVTDIVNLVSITAMIQDGLATNDKRVVKGKMASAIKGAPVEVYSIMCSLNEFAERACGSHDKAAALESGLRLATYTAVFRFPEGGMATARYLHSFEYNKATDMVSFAIKETTLEQFKQAGVGWSISIKSLRSIKGNVAKAIWMYLQQQPGNRFRILFFAELLRLGGEKFEQRRVILTAFNALKGEKYISDFVRDGDYVVLKRSTNDKVSEKTG